MPNKRFAPGLPAVNSAISPSHFIFRGTKIAIDNAPSGVELNSIITPEFIDWLEGKMDEHGVGKVISTEDVIAKTFEESVERSI